MVPGICEEMEAAQKHVCVCPGMCVLGTDSKIREIVGYDMQGLSKWCFCTSWILNILFYYSFPLDFLKSINVIVN